METKTLEVIPGELYDVHVQEWRWDISEEPTSVRAAYTKDGYYIGDEKTADYLTKDRGLTQLQPAKSGDNVCSIGFHEPSQKWFGWSHRAIFGYGIGDSVAPGDCAFKPRTVQEWIQKTLDWHKDDDHGYGLGKIKNFSWNGETNTLSIETHNSSLIVHEHLDPDNLGNGAWTAKTLDDAKQMAQEFAESVSSSFDAVATSSSREFNPTLAKKSNVRKMKLRLTSTGKDTGDLAKATFTISGKAECVQRVAALLAMIQVNGDVGHSGIFGMSWDGDGADHIKIEGIEPFIKSHKDGINACSDFGSYFEFVGEGGRFYVSVNTKEVTSKLVWPKD
jgi:hypothetical protein